MQLHLVIIILNRTIGWMEQKKKPDTRVYPSVGLYVIFVIIRYRGNND